MDGDPLVRLRALCLALPEITERLGHGEPTWFVSDKMTSSCSRTHSSRRAREI